MKKVFVFTTSYPNPDNPQANIFVKEQVDALSKWDNQIIVLNVRKKPTKFLLKKINRNVYTEENRHSDVVFIEQKTLLEARLTLLNQIFFDKSVKKLYKFAIRKYGKPDVIYAHFYSAAYAATKVCEDIPIVVLEHSGILMNNKISLANKFFLEKVINISKCYIVTSDMLKRCIEKHIKKNGNIKIIPNMVDDAFCYYPCDMKRKDFVFFSLARMSYDKRIDLLIEAFSEAFNEKMNIKLLIGGSGSEYKNIEKLIKDKGLDKQVLLLGELDRHETLCNYINCNCFVLPSRHETFGLVWREAMCVGRPIITTNHGGFSDKDFKSEYGIMISKDSKSELIESMKYMYLNWKQYDLKLISKENCDMYSSSSIAERINQELEKVII